MGIEHYASVDDILGDSRLRYFSWGFRRVRHNLHDIKIDPTLRSLTANASITYPTDWSTKQTSSELVPHLSTLDAILLSLHLCAAYLVSVYGLSRFQVTHIWLRKLVIKAGGDPQFDLANTPVQTRFLSTEESEDSLCGYLSRFTCEFGGMKVELTLDHHVNTVDNRVKIFHCLCEVMDDIKQGYFGSVYREATQHIHDVVLDTEALSASSWVSVNYQERFNVDGGVSAAYYPFYSIVDSFVCISQQMQALLYRLDNVTRATSNNLWMRTVEYESKMPIYRPGGFRQSVKIEKTRILQMNNSPWRMADFRGHVDFKINDEIFSVRVGLAHEVPRELGLNVGFNEVATTSK